MPETASELAAGLAASQMGSIQPKSKNIFFPIDGFAVRISQAAQMTLKIC